MNRILLIEDEVAISDMIKDYLATEGFHITVAYDGKEALEEFNKATYDLILLDLMLPIIDGMSVMKKIREKSLIPILILSAKDSDVDKVLGLGFGADDYIPKPFSLIDLLARIKANIRRATQYSNGILEEQKQSILTVGDLEIDLENFSVIKNGKDLKLTSKEFAILKIFVTNPNRVFTKAQIYGFIWEDTYYGDDNIINVHIRRLREKIEDDPSNPIYIKTLWGIGYKMEAF